MVHRREIDGREVVFGNQGDLWQNAMTWFDHDTGSVWSQPTGEAIIGPLKGTSLELLPSSLTTWTDWKARFPETLALDTLTRSTRFSLEQMAVVAVVGDDSLAIPIAELRELRAVSTELWGEPVIITLDPDIDRWAAYSLRHGERILDLILNEGVLIDSATGDEWDAARGASMTGGDPLDRVSVFSSFPEDYVRIFPEGRVLVGGVIQPSTNFG